MIKSNQDKSQTDFMILLVSMPLADPILPNLAIEQLAAIARLNGIDCKVLYGTLLMPRVSQKIIHGLAGPAIFTPYYYKVEQNDIAERIAKSILQQANCDAKITDEVISDTEIEFLSAMDAAKECLDRCMLAISKEPPDIVGFSVGFDAQKMPSAALAKRIKAVFPETVIVFGGTACDGAMGKAILELFPEVDVVVQGEAETHFPKIIRRIRSDESLEDVPGCIYRFEKKILSSRDCELNTSLDLIPEPDYQVYFSQREASPYNAFERIVLFESSRGCWWGEKHHCKFCGILAVDSKYRIKSIDRVVQHIENLENRFSPDLLYSTDSILSMQHLRSVLPKLSTLRREGKLKAELFFEVKSNLRRDQIASLACAGVKRVQPGIETFNSHILRLMSKGVSGINQVEFLKWARAYGIVPVYGLLVGTPGERVEDCNELLSTIKTIQHLPPPAQTNFLALHKFSPYDKEPARYGLCDIRPFEAQRVIYQASDDILLRLCYESDYTNVLNTIEHAQIHSEISDAVGLWRNKYYSGEQLSSCYVDGGVNILHRAFDGEVTLHCLRGIQAELYGHCESAATPESISAKLGYQLGALGPPIEELQNLGLLLNLDGRLLALAIPTPVDCWEDAGIPEANGSQL